MYLTHFGFTEWPFSNTPDPRFVYLSPRHEEALAHLLYGVRERGGFVQLTGEVGTGKTTTCRYLLSQLPEGVDVALVVNPMLTPEELLATVCDELGAAYPPEARTRKAFVDVLYRHLLAAHGQGRRTVLIVDEAQNLSPDALEQLRLLTNLETATDKLLQIILIGQPELTALLARTQLRQVAQRITARYHLLPFTERDTRAYVARRLQTAGQGLGVLEPSAVLAVHRASRGVPRLVNVICDRALLGAFARGSRTVSARTVRRAAREVAGEERGVRRQPRAGLIAAAVVGLVLVAASVAAWAGAWTVPSLRVLRNVRLTAAPDVGPPRMVALSTRDGAPGASVVSAPSASLTPSPAVAAPGIATAARPTPDLAALLAAAPPANGPAQGLVRVLARWGVTVAPEEDPCRVAVRAGLECYDGRGTWTVVRRLGVPVVVKLVTPDGARHYAAVMTLDGDIATLQIGERAEPIPVGAVERLWDGVFSTVWRPLPGVARVLGPGMQGPGVAWLRRALSDGEIGGRDRGPAVYDEALAARVVAFQRREGLDADGMAGIETLVRVSTRLDARAPRLTNGSITR
jgi:general secretion pathway protein A